MSEPAVHSKPNITQHDQMSSSRETLKVKRCCKLCKCIKLSIPATMSGFQTFLRVSCRLMAMSNSPLSCPISSYALEPIPGLKMHVPATKWLLKGNIQTEQTPDDSCCADRDLLHNRLSCCTIKCRARTLSKFNLSLSCNKWHWSITNPCAFSVEAIFVFRFSFLTEKVHLPNSSTLSIHCATAVAAGSILGC